MKHIPNIITSLNLCAGFIAIIFVMNGDLLTGSWLIVASMIFDFLDGFSARLLKFYSPVGKELDSLADVVSFGVVPALIICKLLARSFQLTVPFSSNSDTFSSSLILCSTAIMPVCAAFRLAIFNTDHSQVRSFKGLPTPANALAIISLVIASHYSDSSIYRSFADSPAALVSFTLILSFLMVSRIPLLSLKITDLKFGGNEGRYILILMIAIAFIFAGINATPLIIPLYIIASLMDLLFK